MNTKNLNYLNIFLMLGMFLINYMSTSWKLGFTMLNLSKIFDFDYMPPGAVFGIAWWSIFLLHIFWLKKLFEKNDRYWSLIFAVSCVLNALWVLLTSAQQFGLAAIVIAILMYVLWLGLGHFRKNDISKIAVWSYFGWISIATVVLSLSQMVYLVSPALARSTWYTIFVIALWIITTYLTYQKHKNIWATVFACIWLGWAVLGLLTR